MKLTLNPADVQVLTNESGEPNAHAFKAANGELLTVIGGVLLGVPTTDEDGNLVFSHDFPAEAVQTIATRAATRGAVLAEVTPDTDASLFRAWTPGLDLDAGDIVAHDDTLYRVVQAHATQAGWEPTAAPALFTPYFDPADGPAPWTQPTGAHDAYALGARVTHAGHTWESTAPDNVWEPGVYGWTQVG